MAFLQDRIINPIRTSKSAQVLAYGGLALFVIYVLLTRVTGNLPDVMGDELVYATAALHAPMSTAAIPDYLYYWVYGSTGVCGIGFYGCSQVLNTLFSLGAGLLVMVIARRFISQWASILIALVFVLGPLSASNSYFMPESMFYFFLALLLWHLTKQVEQRSLGFWIQAGVYLALLSLVKPHALLLGAGIGTYLLATQWGENQGRWVRLVKEGGALVLATVVVKFGLGLIFAGPNGITLFGNSYTGTLSGTLSGSISNAPAGSPAASVDHSFGTSLSFIFGQIGVETLAVVFLGALPLAAAVRYLWRSRKSVEANKPLADFSFLIVNTLAWMVILIAIFSNMTRLTGEDTANRIMLRYFEFLIPLLLITLVAAAEKGLTVKPAMRWLLAGVGGILTIVASTYITQTPAGAGGPRYNLQFVDSPMLKVLLGTYSNDATTGAPIYWMAITVVVVTLIALALWAANPRWGAVTWVAAITPVLLLLSNNAMVSNYAWRSNYTMASDTAGEFVRDSIPGDELKNLIIVAPSNSNKSDLVAKFHINNPDVMVTEVNEGAPYAAPANDTNIKWELALGNVALTDKGYTVAQAGGVQLLRRDLGDIAIFNNHTYNSTLLGATMGLDSANAQGMCATSTAIQLNLNRQVMAPDQVRLGLTAAGMGANQQYSIRIGETTQNVTLSNPQRPLNALLNATNNQASGTVYINLPNVQGAGLCVSYIEYIPKH
jgi:phosphoglycerol transferase